MLRDPTLERFFCGTFARDASALGALFAEGVVGHAPPFAAEPFGALEGRQAVLDWLRFQSQQAVGG